MDDEEALIVVSKSSQIDVAASRSCEVARQVIESLEDWSRTESQRYKERGCIPPLKYCT